MLLMSAGRIDKMCWVVPDDCRSDPIRGACNDLFESFFSELGNWIGVDESQGWHPSHIACVCVCVCVPVAKKAPKKRDFDAKLNIL